MAKHPQGGAVFVRLFEAKLCRTLHTLEATSLLTGQISCSKLCALRPNRRLGTQKGKTKMNAKTIMAAFCAAGLVCAAFAEEAKPKAEAAVEVEEKDDGLSYTPGEGVSYGEQKIVTAEVGLSFDSKYMTYGVVDGKDPILTPSAKATFFDWVYLGA